MSRIRAGQAQRRASGHAARRAGEHVIKGLGGNDVLIGGKGNDRIIGGGKDRFLGTRACKAGRVTALERWLQAGTKRVRQLGHGRAHASTKYE
jgi:hypothetical protein